MIWNAKGTELAVDRICCDNFVSQSIANDNQIWPGGKSNVQHIKTILYEF